jgi:hypothetical protein
MRLIPRYRRSRFACETLAFRFRPVRRRGNSTPDQRLNRVVDRGGNGTLLFGRQNAGIRALSRELLAHVKL